MSSLDVGLNIMKKKSCLKGKKEQVGGEVAENYY